MGAGEQEEEQRRRRRRVQRRQKCSRPPGFEPGARPTEDPSSTTTFVFHQLSKNGKSTHPHHHPTHPIRTADQVWTTEEGSRARQDEAGTRSTLRLSTSARPALSSFAPALLPRGWLVGRRTARLLSAWMSRLLREAGRLGLGAKADLRRGVPSSTRLPFLPPRLRHHTTLPPTRRHPLPSDMG